MAFLEKAKKQDLVLLAEELGQKVSDKMTIIDLKNIIIGSKDYEEEFVRAQLSVISEERVERETEEKIARQHAIQQLRWESESNELRLEIESIRSNVKRTSCAEDRKKTSSNYRISIGRAEEHMRETTAVLMAEATIPVTTPIKEEKGMDDLRVVHVKGEQGILNASIDTGAQIPVVTADVVGGQSVDNKGTIQITSAFWEHEIGELKGSNMELNDLRHGVVPVSKNLVNDMLICSSDYEGLIENSLMDRNPAILREPSGEEGIINSVNSESVCSQEVVTDLLPETYTQSLMNVPNGDLVEVKINASNVQTNGQGIKESKREVAFTCVFKNRILYSNRRGRLRATSADEGDKFRRAQRAIFPLIGRNSELNLYNKLLLYTAVLRPILTYGSPVWGYAANSNIKILEVAQNSLIRNIVKANRYARNSKIYEDIKISPFKAYIQKLAISFFNSLPNSNNANVKMLNNYIPMPDLKRPRRILLDSYNPPNN
ncbi:RNA-directed DNA polymerase from mobile element jockey [Trichonephila clavipes]|nr:RNA-directed DNA polymerase from mobile element jockey [Trichonephila clavipes]